MLMIFTEVRNSIKKTRASNDLIPAELLSPLSPFLNLRGEVAIIAATSPINNLRE